MASSPSLADQLLDLAAGCIEPSSLEALANFRLSPRLAARVQKLAKKANEGTLKPGERAEYKSYVEVRGLLAILQSKARLRLATAC